MELRYGAGPISDKITGRRINPWKRPKTTTNRNTLKKTENTWDSLPARRMNAINVDMPPFRTAGPMSTRAAAALSLLVPDTVKKA